jgi:hypothetical protein
MVDYATALTAGMETLSGIDWDTGTDDTPPTGSWVGDKGFSNPSALGWFSGMDAAGRNGRVRSDR